MTDRLKGVVVTFAKDVREDDAEEVLNAIRMIKGVISVKPILAEVSHDGMVAERVRLELWEKMRKVFFPGVPDEK